MKSFFKKLAFVMALAMVVSMVAPAGSALAAESGVSLQGTKTIVETYELDKVGATVDFSFQGAPKDWKSTFKWTSSNEAVATVDKAGIVTAVAAGTATIKITAGADASYAETVVVTVKAEEVKGDFEITQLSTNTVTLAFDKAPAEADLAKDLAFNMVIAGVPVTLPVNTVKVKDNVATVTVFNTFVDGEEYSFVYGDKEATFVASVGEIDHVEFWYYTGEDASKNHGIAWVNEEDGEDFETTFVPVLYDANNIDITAKYDLDDDLDITYELVNANDDIELDEDEGVITFDTVAAAAVRMTVAWEDKDDEEVSKNYTGVVVAEKLPEVALEYVNSGFIKAETYVDGAVEDFTTNQWGAFWNGTISLSNSYTLPEDANTYQFAALFNDNRGNKVVSGADYKYGTFSFESSNDDVLDIDEDGELSFYEAGSAYILVYFTPETDDDDAKPVFVGSKKLTVAPAKYATAFKVLNTSASAATNALTLHSWDSANYNRVCFEVQVTDQTGAGMWTADFAGLFNVEAVKEENTVTYDEIAFDWNTGTYKVWFDADDFTLKAGDDSAKFKYELSMDTDAEISKNIKNKEVTLTLKVEDNKKEALEMAAYLADIAANYDCGLDEEDYANAEKADSFDIVGFKGGYPIDLNIKQVENWKAVTGDAKYDVKLGWANNLKYVDSNDYNLAAVPAENIIYKTKDITTGELGKVYFTISAPAKTVTYDKETKAITETVNWNYVVCDGGVTFQWNNSEVPTDYYDKTADYVNYATPGDYSVTFYTAKKDGGKLYDKGTSKFTITNSQALPTYEGFNPDYTNYTDLDITDDADALDAIVMKHLVFKFNGAKLDSEDDWDAADMDIDWANSDYSVIEGEKLRIKKLVIEAPIDDKDGDDHYFYTTVSVGKNIYAEDEE